MLISTAAVLDAVKGGGSQPTLGPECVYQDLRTAAASPSVLLRRPSVETADVLLVLLPCGMVSVTVGSSAETTIGRNC